MPFRLTRRINAQRKAAKDLDKALEKISEYAEGRIKDKTPVVTGRLKGSMEAKKFGFLKHGVVTNVEYARAVEYGTSSFAGRKMMRNGIKEAQKRANYFIKKELN